MSEWVRVVYTNWRGETAARRILPQSIWFGASEHHPERQWFLDAIDCDRGVLRSFAMKDLSDWEGAS